MALFWGGLGGFLALVAGAYGDHGLKAHLSPLLYESWKTAVSSQQLHSLLVGVVGLSGRKSPWLTASTLFLTIGMLLFSGSLYGRILLEKEQIIFLTPIGGISLMLGWLCLLGEGGRGVFSAPLFASKDSPPPPS